MKKGFSTDKIISILQEREEGSTITEITRKHGINPSYGLEVRFY